MQSLLLLFFVVRIEILNKCESTRCVWCTAATCGIKARKVDWGCAVAVVAADVLVVAAVNGVFAIFSNGIAFQAVLFAKNVHKR